MATGYSVTEALNRNSKECMDESPRARFRTKDISIFKMYRNTLNFYSIEDVEELAGDILMYGLKQNLEVVYSPCEEGEYRITAGERRWEALKLLVSKGYREFEMATCKQTAPQDTDEEQVEIIIANAYRTKTISDMIEEEKRLKSSLERIKAAGKTIKGYDLTSGRLRDVIARMLNMSKTKIAQIESVNNNLIPEFCEELKKERLTFSAAYELSGMSEDEQKEAYEKFTEEGELSHKEIKSMKEGTEGEEERPEEPQEEEQENGVSESDTDSSIDEEAEEAEPEGLPDEEYQEEERHETAYAEKAMPKTEEEQYAEEQRKIDRETANRLREMEDEERMKILPSEMEGTGPRTHQLRVGKTFFEEVLSGKRTFELGKCDKGYKSGDILEYVESADGQETGRSVSMIVQYIVGDSSGLEEGYCIMAIAPAGSEANEKSVSIEAVAAPIQPPFPTFKNNTERKAWLEDVEAWGLWYEDKNIQARYYKYDFPDGSRLIAVKYKYTYPEWMKGYEIYTDNEKWDGEYKNTYYHMIYSEEYSKTRSFEYQRYYTHATESVNNLVEFIKKLSKKEKTNE